MNVICLRREVYMNNQLQIKPRKKSEPQNFFWALFLLNLNFLQKFLQTLHIQGGILRLFAGCLHISSILCTVFYKAIGLWVY